MVIMYHSMGDVCQSGPALGTGIDGVWRGGRLEADEKSSAGRDFSRSGDSMAKLFRHLRLVKVAKVPLAAISAFIPHQQTGHDWLIAL
jgi:hypothetical protein